MCNKFVFLGFILLMQTGIKAQYLTYSNGEPVRETRVGIYNGSPYLFKNFIPATVNNKYQIEQFNVNLADYNMTVFKTNDSLFRLRDRVDSFKVFYNNKEMHFKRGILLHPKLGDDFVEVISDSPVLVKAMKKNLSEQASYGAQKTYYYSDVNEYYTVINREPVKVKLSKGDAQQVFSSKWKEIEAYAASRKTSFRSEEGWRELAAHYRTLQK